MEGWQNDLASPPHRIFRLTTLLTVAIRLAGTNEKDPVSETLGLDHLERPKRTACQAKVSLAAKPHLSHG